MEISAIKILKTIHQDGSVVLRTFIAITPRMDINGLTTPKTALISLLLGFISTLRIGGDWDGLRKHSRNVHGIRTRCKELTKAHFLQRARPMHDLTRKREKRTLRLRAL